MTEQPMELASNHATEIPGLAPMPPAHSPAIKC